MVDHGLDVHQAIQAATLGGARALSLEGSVGSIEVGKRADLVVFSGDPLTDPSVFRDSAAVRFVMRGGVVYRSEETDVRSSRTASVEDGVK